MITYSSSSEEAQNVPFFQGICWKMGLEEYLIICSFDRQDSKNL